MRARRSGRVWGAVVMALVVHGLALLAWTRLPSTDDSPVEVQQASPALSSVAPIALIELDRFGKVVVGEPLVGRVGQSDRMGPEDSSLVPAPFDSSGTSAGAASAGAPGQSARFDREDPSLRNATLWNRPDRDHELRRGQDRTRSASTEALARAEVRRFDDGDSSQRRAREGLERAQPGLDTESDGARGGALFRGGVEWLSEDPLLDSPQRAQQRVQDGSTRPAARAALVEVGEHSVDRHRRGTPEDAARANAESSATHPSPFDQGAASVGGDLGLGADGRKGRSVAGARGRGTAADAQAASSPGIGATFARRSDPYFRELYRRIDAEIRFPKQLALALEQGEVTLRLVLHADGSISELQIEQSSGFQAFDREAKRAFRKAAPFGAPPAALLGGRTELVVLAPYFFRNPLIR